MAAGYYRTPTIHGDTIVFVSEDDLWSVSVHGGVPRRLTSNISQASFPIFSPDGERLAFVGEEEGATEVFVMPAAGGSAQRLTYLGSRSRVIAWSADGSQIIFMSNYGQVVAREYALFTVRWDDSSGATTQLPYGPAQAISFGPQGQVILGRHMDDPARWKRYRGGTAGQLWIDRVGDGQFVRFDIALAGSIAAPMWIAPPAAAASRSINWRDGGRIFFAGDHEGVGNLYSCLPDGADLRRHTDHEDYYVRNPTTDGRRIVYHVCADLFYFDLVSAREERVAVEYRSPRIQRNRRFVDAARYLNNITLDSRGRAVALTSRGKLFNFYNHDGPVLQLGKRDGVRYRLPDWLNKTRGLVVVSDELGEEMLEIHTADPDASPRRLEGIDIGRAINLKVSPVQDKVALTNHRHELLIVDVASGEMTLVERSPHQVIRGFDWSPDGRWIAYSFAATSKTAEIRLYRLPDPDAEDAALHVGAIHTVTQPVLMDVRPAFDPEGKYLYFLSYREFNPVHDMLHFDLGFPGGMRPYLITLRADLPDPFTPHPELEGEESAAGANNKGDKADESASDEDADENEDQDEGENENQETQAEEQAPGQGEPLQDAHPPAADDALPTGAAVADGDNATAAAKASKAVQNDARRLRIDLEGITQRVVAFPVPDGRYGSIQGVAGKALFTYFPVRGALDDGERWDDETPESGTLRVYNFKEYRTETLLDGINWFAISRDGKKLLYASGRRLRVINAGEKPPTESGHPRRTGWIDLSRVKISLNPPSEWAQMFREAWRLQRDHFWTEDMADVDWQIVYDRYFPLIERVSTRGEFSDLMWEMQGELGTSHAYEYGGDYRWSPYFNQGFLGAAFTWDAAARGYRVGEFLIGDPWDKDANSPLAGPGIDVQPGDLLIAVNGQRLDEQISPAQMLVNQAGYEVLLTFAPRATPASNPPDEASPSDQADQPAPGQENAPPSSANRYVVVRAMPSERAALYRAWVEGNRQRVHIASAGRVGYVHIPDMGDRGYAEFHRGYLAEVGRDALIIDVRYNAGGNVSELILEKLARRRIGYDYSRWGGLTPYPSDSVAGPLVALTNEHAGSDGDIFCHSFKLLQLGPLVGKRTWGGVIGISPRHALVDGTMTTQPEYSHWFEDVGWNVENYGTDPDIEVDIAPQDYVAGRDPQLERAIQEVLQRLTTHSMRKPNLEERPSRALPKLPPRALEG